jgi:[ribosomal protein S18]-alanine N-acetyltransferase
MKIEVLKPLTFSDSIWTKDALADFLFLHLEQYGDRRDHIMRAIEYALDPSRGGMIITASENHSLLGVSVINSTGMHGYIPSNILVYIAVDHSKRGMGIGKAIMNQAIESTEGGIALHVEPDNPARKLYEKLGFTNKYLEMRYQHVAS